MGVSQSKPGSETKGLTVLEAADLAQALAERWGVSVSAAAAVTGAAAARSVSDPRPDAARYDVVLTSDGEQMIKVVKEVRALTRLDLAAAKAAVEGAPAVILQNVGREEAEAAKRRLEQAGGAVELVGGEFELTDEEAQQALMLGVRQYVDRALGSPQNHLAYVRSQISKAAVGVGS